MADNRQGRYYRQDPLKFQMLASHPFAMAKKKHSKGRKRTYIKEWRKFRNFTQEQLAGRLEGVISQGSLSDLERGEFDYVQSTLEAIAGALNCRAGDLIMRPPDTNAVLRDVLEELDASGQKRALALLRALKDSEAA
jgi:transcriptional regulator with XRE-family HTH domain